MRVFRTTLPAFTCVVNSRIDRNLLSVSLARFRQENQMELADLEYPQLAELWRSVLSSGGSPRDFKVDSLNLAKFYGALTQKLSVVPPEWWVDALFGLEVRYHRTKPIPFFPRSANSIDTLNESKFQCEFEGEKFELNADLHDSNARKFAVSFCRFGSSNKIWETDNFRRISSHSRNAFLSSSGFQAMQANR